MISVLVVDDSLLVRKRIARVLDSDRRIEVVGCASNGKEALDLMEKIKPDVITLDVEMPVLNGIETLKILSAKYPDIPVVMLSALTREGADVTMQALELGALDFISKPDSGTYFDGESFKKDLILKIRASALVREGRTANLPSRYKQRAEEFGQKKGNGKKPSQDVSSETPEKKNETATLPVQPVSSRKTSRGHSTNPAVVIGISTGGPKTLMDVVPRFPEDFSAPIFIAQHMPAGFTRSLADRLNAISKIEVREAKNGEAIRPGVCYIAPGNQHMTVANMSLSQGAMIKVSDKPADTLYKPSVDILVSSVAQVYGSNLIAVIMTGMGSDGTRGVKDAKQLGARVIAEAQSTCVVFGMSRSVIEAGLADMVVPAGEIPSLLRTMI